MIPVHVSHRVRRFRSIWFKIFRLVFLSSKLTKVTLVLCPVFVGVNMFNCSLSFFRTFSLSCTE